MGSINQYNHQLINIIILLYVINVKFFFSSFVHITYFEIYNALHRKLKSDLAASYQTPSFMQVSVTDAAI